MNAIVDFKGILELAKQKATGRRPKAVLAVPSDVTTLKSFINAVEMNLIEPVIIGDENLLRSKCSDNDIKLPDVEIFDIIEPIVAVETAMKMAVEGSIDLIVKGKFDIFSFINILKDESLGFITKNSASHIFAFKSEKYDKLLFVSDSYLSIEPDLKQKLVIINNSVKTAQSVGLEKPKVALLSAVEAVSPQMPVTIEAAVIAKMSDRNQIKNCVVDGPLSFDIAIDHEAAEHKGIKNSEVAGEADILIAPNMATAQGIYKAVSLYTDSQAGHVITGGKVPVVFGLEFEDENDRFNSILLGILTA